ncbi:hypothetical protein ACXWOM_10110, partial [Streptococcus pyogenes]
SRKGWFKRKIPIQLALDRDEFHDDFRGTTHIRVSVDTRNFSLFSSFNISNSFATFADFSAPPLSVKSCSQNTSECPYFIKF